MSKTKAEIAADVASDAEITKVRAGFSVDVIIDVLKQALLSSRRIEIRGFGVLVVRPRKRGIGRNPRTGVPVPINPGRTVRFKPGEVLCHLLQDEREGTTRLRIGR